MKPMTAEWVTNAEGDFAVMERVVHWDLGNRFVKDI